VEVTSRLSKGKRIKNQRGREKEKIETRRENGRGKHRRRNCAAGSYRQLRSGSWLAERDVRFLPFKLWQVT